MKQSKSWQHLIKQLMKTTYFKSLFPWRWILPFTFIFIISFMLLMIFTLAKTPTPLAILGFIGNIVGWILIDYVLGIGQLSIWERRTEAKKILVTIQCKQTIIHDKKIYVTEDEFKVISNAESALASQDKNKEVFQILRKYLSREDNATQEQLTDITIDVARTNKDFK